jgi:hypothetical protein
MLHHTAPGGGEPGATLADSGDVHTFDARLKPGTFWAAVLVPPLVFWIVLEGVVNTVLGGQIGMAGVLGLMALAYGLPLGALAWILCSVAAYSIEPGRLVVHRVVRDRVFPLTGLVEPASIQAGAVLLRWRDLTLQIRPQDVAGCAAAIEHATGMAGPRDPR